MKIIAHRGYWLEFSERNSVDAFKRAWDNGFGIETDIRDYCGEIVISHDLPTASSLKLSDFLKIGERFNNQELALNIKSDGLQKKLLESNIDNFQHFFFDMSVPDAIEYKNLNLNFYTRYSELEINPSLYNSAKGIWLDKFHSEDLDIPALLKFLQDSKFVVLVSPELHGFAYGNFWNELKGFLHGNSEYINKLSICTDFPLDAKEYFGESTDY